jgi:2,4-dienoyl-CoA reductase-like NADH-dependent reductase (Old Yellow Enzyme family)
VDLFSPIALGDLRLAHRVVMAPLTRLRAGASGVPGDLIVEHYAQRASLGMIITEGVWPDPQGQGYPGQPGIVTDEQVEGWRKVAEAVHERGGRIVMQLMHAGRVSHPDVNGGREVEAPSAVAIEGEIRTPVGKKPYPVPHALTTEELARVRDEFVQAARNAVAAGLGGVELHGANGYLLHEFLSPASNERSDSYGGSPENRARFVVEVATRWPRRSAPGAWACASRRSTTSRRVRDRRGSGFASVTSREEAISLIVDAHAEAVAVGRPVIADPDLVERWAGEHPENEPQPHSSTPSATRATTTTRRWSRWADGRMITAR